MVQASPYGLQILSPEPPKDAVPQRRGPRHRNGGRKLSTSQKWLNQRLAGLAPTDFHEDGVLIYSPEGLHVPAGFASIDTLTETNECAAAVLIFADLWDEDQVQNVEQFSSCMDSVRSPFLILVPHSISPASSKGSNPCDAAAFQLEMFNKMVNVRIDDMIVGEPKGFRLGFEVQSRLAFHIRLSRDLDALLNRDQADRGYKLKRCIDDTLWNYVRIRFGTQIPEKDESIPPGEPTRIEEYSFGKTVGRGSFGKVFEVRNLCDEAHELRQVIKSVAKNGMHLTGIKGLKNEIMVMKLLSSEEMQHPNVTKLYDIYHSETHVFLRMEFGGPENLDQRLKSRDSKDNDRRPLSLEKIVSIANACLSTMEHLHTQAKVAHRDLKGGNILIFSETAQGISIKIADFGLAKIVQKNPLCQGKCGTLPYMAPEILLEGAYDVFTADVWSLGVVILDILCMNRFIQCNVFDKEDEENCRNDVCLMQCLRNWFDSSGKVEDILKRHMRADYCELLKSASVLLDGVLDVVPRQRLSAAQAAVLPLSMQSVP